MVEFSFDPDDIRPRDDSFSDRERRERDRIDEMRFQEERDRREQEFQEQMELARTRKMADVVNDESIEVDKALMNAINDPEIQMNGNGDLVKITRRDTGFGRAIRRQFRRDAILPRTARSIKKKTVSKARKELNKLQSQAFEQANKELRTLKGKLRKGVTQSDVAKRAQKILKQLRKL
jgi:anion-transporting  ArsA/GET3 family ATPase